MAALLGCGPAAVLSHETAAVVWRIREPRRGEAIHVTVPPGGVRARPGVRLHREGRHDEDVATRIGLRVFTPARVHPPARGHREPRPAGARHQRGRRPLPGQPGRATPGGRALRRADRGQGPAFGARPSHVHAHRLRARAEVPASGAPCRARRARSPSDGSTASGSTSSGRAWAWWWRPMACAITARRPSRERTWCASRRTRPPALSRSASRTGRWRASSPGWCARCGRRRPGRVWPAGQFRLRSAGQATRRERDEPTMERTERADFQATTDPGLMESADRGQSQLLSYGELYSLWERQQWAVQDIDFTQDRIDWHERIPAEERYQRMAGLSSFFIGEQRVAAELGPMMRAAPQEDMRIFLCTQIADEARHVAFFDRFYSEVGRARGRRPGRAAGGDQRARERELRAAVRPDAQGPRRPAGRRARGPGDAGRGGHALPHDHRGDAGPDRPALHHRVQRAAGHAARLRGGLQQRRPRRAPPRGLRRRLPARHGRARPASTARPSSARWWSAARPPTAC